MILSARKLVDIALIACIAYPTAQSAFGQTVRPGAPPAGQAVPNGTLGRENRREDGREERREDHILQASAVIGSTVFLDGGVNYGTVRDFVISDSGCLEYAVLSADNGLVAIPWGAGTFDFGRRAFVLGFGRDRIRDLPHIRDIAELRDARVKQRVQTFFRGDHDRMRGDQRDNRQDQRDNRQRGVENENQPRQQQQPARTIRGAQQQPQRPQANTRPAAPQNEKGK